LSLVKNGYYLSGIQDMRTNKSNNGYVERDKIKYRLTFNDSLPSYLSSFILPNAEKGQQLGLVPLLLQIEKMRIFSSSDGKFDQAQTYLKLHLINETTKKEVRTFEQTVNYNKKSVPNFIGKVVFETFKAAFVGLKAKPPVASNTTNPQGLGVAAAGDKGVASKNGDSENLTYVIPLASEKVNWENKDYYISDVKDIRVNKQSEGTILNGFFNKKTQAFLDSNVESYVKRSLSSTADSFKKALTMYIKSFTVSQEGTANGEQRSLYFSAMLTYDSLGNQVLVYQNTVKIDSIREEGKTDLWPPVIIKGENDLWPSIILKGLRTYFGRIDTTQLRGVALSSDRNKLLFCNQ